MQGHDTSSSDVHAHQLSHSGSSLSEGLEAPGTASFPGDPTVQRMQLAANSSPQVRQLKRLQEAANQNYAPVQMKSAGDAPVQRLSIAGVNQSIPDLREALLPHFPLQAELAILDRILPVYFPEHNQNYASVEAIAGELRIVIGIYRDLTRTDSMANLVAGQRRGQTDFQAVSGQGWFKRLFTTAGFEHEFVDMHNSFLAGVSHMELARSQEAMPLTNIPFILETDASNALELVSPPFLLPTVQGTPLPDPDIVRTIDDRMRQDLAATAPALTQRQELGLDPVATTTMGALRAALNGLTGLTFDFTNLEINPEHLSHRADPTAIAPHLQDPGVGGNPQLALEQNDVEAIEIRRSRKSANERHGVSAQLNFATDLETADTLMGPSNVAGAAIYRGLETDLATALNIGAIGDAEVQRFGRYMVKNLCSLFSVYSQNHLRAQQAGFYARLQQQGRHENGHGGGPAAAGLDAAGRQEFRLHAGLCSYVKDSTAIWVKDHLVSQAEGILSTDQARRGAVALIQAARVHATGWNAPAAVTNLGGNGHADPAGHWAHFITQLRASAGAAWADMQMNAGADTTPNVGLYEHNRQFGGARQDTMIDPAHVQQPDLFNKRLHVAEIRRGDPSDQLRNAAANI